MRLVIDTNVFVAALSSRSSLHWVIEMLLDEVFDVIISNEILLEYEEVLKSKYSESIADNFIRSLNELPNVYKMETFYQWKLITNDPDDNKFVDIAISSNADFIVTNDKDFNVLKGIAFPKVAILSVKELANLLAS